jgi:hypothetical protein
MQARQLVERFTGNLPANIPANIPAPQQSHAKTSRDKTGIYVWAGIAVVLIVGLILIFWALYINMRGH